MDWGNRPLWVKVTAGTSIGACAITLSRLVCISGCIDGEMTGTLFLFFVKTLLIAPLCAVEPSVRHEIGRDSVSELLAKESEYR
jgi:hypothetical protein